MDEVAVVQTAIAHGADAAVDELTAGGPLPRGELQQLRATLRRQARERVEQALLATGRLLEHFNEADSPRTENEAMEALEAVDPVREQLEALVQIYKLEREVTDGLARSDVRPQAP